MHVNALEMDDMDNVVTCVKAVRKGEAVVYRKGDTCLTVKAEEAIPFCHKIALRDFRKGDEVIKYGESLGKLIVDVPAGHLIDHTNLKSVPRDYDSEML
jgi:altronate dehydratase